MVSPVVIGIVLLSTTILHCPFDDFTIRRAAFSHLIERVGFNTPNIHFF
jgi:hypothetical protein